MTTANDLMAMFGKLVEQMAEQQAQEAVEVITPEKLKTHRAACLRDAEPFSKKLLPIAEMVSRDSAVKLYKGIGYNAFYTYNSSRKYADYHNSECVADTARRGDANDEISMQEQLKKQRAADRLVELDKQVQEAETLYWAAYLCWKEVFDPENEFHDWNVEEPGEKSYQEYRRKDQAKWESQQQARRKSARSSNSLNYLRS